MPNYSFKEPALSLQLKLFSCSISTWRLFVNIYTLHSFTNNAPQQEFSRPRIPRGNRFLTLYTNRRRDLRAGVQFSAINRSLYSCSTRIQPDQSVSFACHFLSVGVQPEIRRLDSSTPLRTALPLASLWPAVWSWTWAVFPFRISEGHSVSAQQFTSVQTELCSLKTAAGLSQNCRTNALMNIWYQLSCNGSLHLIFLLHFLLHFFTCSGIRMWFMAKQVFTYNDLPLYFGHNKYKQVLQV